MSSALSMRIDPTSRRVAQSLFSPRTIAIIGASADATKHAALAQRHLRHHGYAGQIYPINERHQEILGARAYPNLRAVNQPIDHAFINVPNAAVLDSVRECIENGVACATILTNGFAEVGKEGAIRQQQIVELARSGRLRILGPNSIGVVNVAGHVALSVNEVLSLGQLIVGRCSLISQSGSLIGALLSRGQTRGIGFSKLVSVGNECDLDVAEIGEYLIEDSETDAILLLLETIRNAERFAAMARRAFDSGKPVVAYCMGRSDVGAELAVSHTGAITSNGRAVESFLRECGVVCVRNFEALLEIPPGLKAQKPVATRRISVVTTTGGGASLVLDCLSQTPVDVVPPSVATISRLCAQNVRIGPSRIIDLTLAGTNAQTYGAVLETLLASNESDLVLAVVGSSSLFRPDRAVEPIIDVQRRGYGKPLVVFLTPQADQSLRLLGDAGIAAFRTPESCADAIRAYLEWTTPRPVPSLGADLSRVRAMLGKAQSRSLDSHEARAVFGALGISGPLHNILPIRAESAATWDLPADIKYPVAVKVLSPDIHHKTEVGGVVLNVDNERELRAACARILANAQKNRPNAKLSGLAVESMESGLAEVILGYRVDPCVGPIVIVGVGGVLAELYQDLAVRTAPIDVATAHEMIGEVRGLASLRGYRNMPRGDIDALARATAAVSWLATVSCPQVVEAEINPLVVKAQGQGIVALDSMIICRSSNETL